MVIHVGAGFMIEASPTETPSFCSPSFVLDHPSRVGTIGDTSSLTIQSHVVADSNDLAGFAVKTGASL